MNDETRTHLRGIASGSCAHSFRSQCESGAGIVVAAELKVFGRAGGQLIALSSDDNVSTFQREDWGPTPGWQGVLQCDPRFVRYHFRRLENLGLWELGDFCPAEEILDGEYLIVCGRDRTNTVFQREVDACMFCPLLARNPYIRRLAKHLLVLLTLGKESVAFQSTLSKYRCSWFANLFQ